LLQELENVDAHNTKLFIKIFKRNSYKGILTQHMFLTNKIKTTGNIKTKSSNNKALGGWDDD
jgi:hypothetical protein